MVLVLYTLSQMIIFRFYKNKHEQLVSLNTFSFFRFNPILLSIVISFCLALPILVYAENVTASDAIKIIASCNTIKNATAFNATKLLSFGNPITPCPPHAAVYSALVTSALILAVTIFIREIIRRSVAKNKGAAEPHTGAFSDIIKTQDGCFSLSYLQLLIWTYVISFAFLFIYFFRIFWGDYTIHGELPQNLLALLGISGGATVSSRLIGEPQRNETQQTDNSKKENPTDTGNSQETQDNKKQVEKKSNIDREFHTLFYGGKNQFTLSKFQMFLWTVICVTVYIFFFIAYVNNAVYQLDPVDNKLTETQRHELVNNLTIPDVNNVMLVLMGLSQASYLGVKLSDKKSST